jgi:hypothetical protein
MKWVGVAEPSVSTRKSPATFARASRINTLPTMMEITRIMTSLWADSTQCPNKLQVVSNTRRSGLAPMVRDPSRLGRGPLVVLRIRARVAIAAPRPTRTVKTPIARIEAAQRKEPCFDTTFACEAMTETAPSQLGNKSSTIVLEVNWAPASPLGQTRVHTPGGMIITVTSTNARAVSRVLIVFARNIWFGCH